MAKKKNSSKETIEKMEVIETPIIETTVEEVEEVAIEVEPEIEAVIEEVKEDNLVEVIIEPTAEEMPRIREILGHDDDVIVNEALEEKIREFKDKQVMPMRRSFGYTWNGQEYDW